jgi:ABC-type transport system substrate-binding protein
VLSGAGLVGRRSPISPVFKEWIPTDVPEDEYDIDKAKKTLADAGYTWDGDGTLVMKKM